MRTRFQLGAALALSCTLAGCSGHHGPVSMRTSACDGTAGRCASAFVPVVAVEGVYAEFAREIGGDDVRVTALQHGVDADPHAYEPTPHDAETVSFAEIVIRNGAGYDAFVQKLIDASPNDARAVIDVSEAAHAPAGGNPHLWYDSDADRAFASAFEAELSRRVPADRAGIAARTHRFDRELDVWDAEVAELQRRARGAKVATTEPVFDFVLERAGLDVVTPRSFSLAIEQGNDPAPQDIATLDRLVPSGVRALVLNAQTVAPSTTRLADRAAAGHVPIVRVTESLPDGTSPFAWFASETRALAAAVAPAGAAR